MLSKNVISLAMRVLVVSVVGLFTTKIHLLNVGFSEYGTYITIFSLSFLPNFANAALMNCLQRFFAFSLRQSASIKSYAVFWIGIIIISICFITLIFPQFLFQEQIIQYFFASYSGHANLSDLYNVLLLSSTVALLIIPFTSLITAHEHFAVFSSISVTQAFIKIIIAVIGLQFSLNILVISWSLLISNLVTLIVSYIYCNKNFHHCENTGLNKNLFKKIIAYFFNMSIGEVSAVLSFSGVNLIIYNYLSPEIVSAKAIAQQLSGLIKNFGASLGNAISPRVFKNYGTQNFNKTGSTLFKFVNYTQLFILFVSIFLIINFEFIFQVWVANTSLELKSLVFASLLVIWLESLTMGRKGLLQAKGNITLYQWIIGSILLLNVPLTYVLISYFNLNYLSVVLSMVLLQFIAVFVRIYITSQLLEETYDQGLAMKITRSALPHILLLNVYFIIPASTMLKYQLYNMFIFLIVGLFISYYVSLDRNERVELSKIIKR